MMKKRYSEVFKQLSDKELLQSLFITQILLLVVSATLGVIILDNVSTFFQLFNWRDPNIWFIGGGCGIVVVGLDLLFTKILPPHLTDDGGVNERIFQNRNMLQIAIIACGIAFSEEILFRGILQTSFGLILSSSIFAIIHIRYLFNWFLFLNITLLSFFIGYIYDITDNLSITIFMHFLIDFLLGMIIRIKYKKLATTGRRCSVRE
jgi:uncharacterized protein